MNAFLRATPANAVPVRGNRVRTPDKLRGLFPVDSRWGAHLPCRAGGSTTEMRADLHRLRDLGPATLPL